VSVKEGTSYDPVRARAVLLRQVARVSARSPADGLHEQPAQSPFL
jgi:hypothetical protein